MKLLWWSLFLESFNQDDIQFGNFTAKAVSAIQFLDVLLESKSWKNIPISFCICWRWFPPAWMIAPLDLIKLRLTPFFPLAWYPLVWYFKGSKTSKDFDDRRLSMIRQRNNIGGRYFILHKVFHLDWVNSKELYFIVFSGSYPFLFMLEHISI